MTCRVFSLIIAVLMAVAGICNLITAIMGNTLVPLIPSLCFLTVAVLEYKYGIPTKFLK